MFVNCLRVFVDWLLLALSRTLIIEVPIMELIVIYTIFNNHHLMNVTQTWDAAIIIMSM